MPKVSVLMPVYNTKERYLRDAIDSILAQTFSDFELLIINDASTQKHVEAVVLSYNDPRIKYKVNEANVGITHTRNKLLEWAAGEYLAVMDHDDISLPIRFMRQVEHLDANPDVGVVSSNYEKFSKKERSSKKKKRFINSLIEDYDIRLSLMRTCALIHPASMLRKSVLIDNNIRYENEFTPAEDYALWCRLIPHTKFYNIPEVLFRYRCHSNNTSRVQKNKIKRATMAIYAFVEQENPLLYKQYQLTAKHTAIFRLFGFIPFLKFVSQSQRTWVYLFNIIPICFYKKYSN